MPSRAHQARRPWALLIDFDTCIAELSGDWGGISVSPASRYMLISLFRSLGGAVALITNRSLLEVDRALGLPDIPIAASNGLEMLALRKAAAAPVFGPAAGPQRLRGELISALMASAPFAGRVPVYLSGAAGHDSAYTATNTLGGTGIAVGNQQLAAAMSLPDASAARALLRTWAAELGDATCLVSR
jgi:trehalose-6-phosphatase